MEKLIVDNGFLELEINDSGVLRFNASDFNVYQRFLKLARELPELEKEYSNIEGQADADELEFAGATLDKVEEMDRRIKERLAWVFGQNNDFDQLLDGVNLMAVGKNGERVITNLLNALTPYMERGIAQHRKEAAMEAVAEAKQNRSQRRAKK